GRSRGRDRAGRSLPERVGVHRSRGLHRVVRTPGGQVTETRQSPVPPRARGPVPPLPVPPPEAIRELPPFPGIDPARIRLVANGHDAELACRLLERGPHLGFDTESRPTFVRGEQSDGPHVVQFATLDEAWVFQLGADGVREPVVSLLTAAAVTKV